MFIYIYLAAMAIVIFFVLIAGAGRTQLVEETSIIYFPVSLTFLLGALFMYQELYKEEKRHFAVAYLAAYFIIIFGYVSVMLLGNAEHFANFGTGICKVNGKFSSGSANKCVDNARVEKINNLKSKCEEIKSTCNPKLDRNCAEKLDRVSQKIVYQQNRHRRPTGICKIPCKNKFGYIVPEFGNRCMERLPQSYIDEANRANMTPEDRAKDSQKQRCMTPNGRIISFSNACFDDEEIEHMSNGIHPSLHTTCLTDDSTPDQFDKMCKDRYGVSFGYKSIQSFDCRKGMLKAECADGYEKGVKVPPKSSKCMPSSTDFNAYCTQLAKTKKDSKTVFTGYKLLNSKGCPKGYKRAICDEDYYDGKERYPNATKCDLWTDNFLEKCQSKFGKSSTLKSIDESNCKQGYLRGICNIPNEYYSSSDFNEKRNERSAEFSSQVPDQFSNSTSSGDMSDKKTPKCLDKPKS